LSHRIFMGRTITVTKGTKLRCKSWRQEAILRMLENNLVNAELPEELIIYGGTGKAARNWESYHTIVKTLRNLENDETLVIQSGKPIAVFRTWDKSPRVLMANSNLVPHWSTWEHFRDLEAKDLIMYGQMTAGSWCYIGTQGIIQGTYETFAACAKTHFHTDLHGKIVLTGGLGGMGGAQPLAVTMNQGICIAVECDEKHIDKRIKAGFCQKKTLDIHDAVEQAENAKHDEQPLSIAVLGNCADIMPQLVQEGFKPDVVTDQTSAHDALHGYIPSGYYGKTLADALKLRTEDPENYIHQAMASMKLHCQALVEFNTQGSVVFDYGNNLRGQAGKAGFEQAFAYPGFVQAYIRPLFCIGRGPFRWIALTGDPDDILKTDKAVLELFPKDTTLSNWIHLAEQHLPWEGLPARVCWLGLGERALFALEINRMVREGDIGTIAITRDHLDSGSVASPYRETEGMRDGSDAIADWPLLNALLNCAAGADSVQIHNGGGVGIGFSTHAGMVVVCDGTLDTDERIRRVFTTDPGIGVARHADAGYPSALDKAKEQHIQTPLLTQQG
jgi:urocanate hydratase